MFSHIALDKVISLLKGTPSASLLDVGCGAGQHSRLFLNAGLKVTGLDIVNPNINHENFTFKHGLLESMGQTEQYDCLWLSHVLEHTFNPDLFLTTCRKLLKPEGLLAITVPPLKHQIVGGHINLFNAGLLIYRLILAQFDCRNVMIKSYGYNISLIVRNSLADYNPGDLKYDNGDIETLSEFFPKGYNYQGFNGDIKTLNWD